MLTKMQSGPDTIAGYGISVGWLLGRVKDGIKTMMSLPEDLPASKCIQMQVISTEVTKHNQAAFLDCFNCI